MKRYLTNGLKVALLLGMTSIGGAYATSAEAATITTSIDVRQDDKPSTLSISYKGDNGFSTSVSHNTDSVSTVGIAYSQEKYSFSVKASTEKTIESKLNMMFNDRHEVGIEYKYDGDNSQALITWSFSF